MPKLNAYLPKSLLPNKDLIELLGKNAKAQISMKKGQQEIENSAFLTDANGRMFESVDDLAEAAPIILKYLPKALTMQALVYRATMIDEAEAKEQRKKE